MDCVSKIFNKHIAVDSYKQFPKKYLQGLL